jgi:flagellin-like protein
MDIKELFNDDSAVSPVIGVILMVAITVILAAVIATFVLGLGDSVSNTAPQASFNLEYDQSSTVTNAGGGGAVTVTHAGGDSIKQSELYIRGSNIVSGQTGKWSGISGSTVGTNSKVRAGNQVDIGVTNKKYDIRVVYQSSEGDTSATLAQDSGPNA